MGLRVGALHLLLLTTLVLPSQEESECKRDPPDTTPGFTHQTTSLLLAATVFHTNKRRAISEKTEKMSLLHVSEFELRLN